MKDDKVMRRLRAARSQAGEPGDHADLFARLVAEPGDPRLAHAPHERSSRFRGRKAWPRAGARPRVLAGSTLGLAGIGTALVLVLSGSSASPAFALTTLHDGSVTVKINRPSGIAGAEHKLATMGVHVRLRDVGGEAGAYGCVPAQPGQKTVSLPYPTGSAFQGQDYTMVLQPNGDYVLSTQDRDRTAPGTGGGNTGTPPNVVLYWQRCSDVTGNTGG